jgi:hypothetical protein
MNGPVNAVLEDVSCIWRVAPHNAFTDLIHWRGNLLCAFREGRKHISTDGRIRVLRSGDGLSWESLACVELAGYDLRDADLSQMPDGRLLLVGGIAERPEDHVRATTNTFFSISDDGEVWSDPVETTSGGRWIWRVTWHEDRVYGVSYGIDGNIDFHCGLEPGKMEVVAPSIVVEGRPSEVKLAFDESGTCYAFVRRDESPYTPLLGAARAPYVDWTWKDLGLEFPCFGGPNLIATPYGWIAGGRMFVDGVDFDGSRHNVYTALTSVDPESGTMTPLLRLPSGGDCSYPGFVWDAAQDLLWMSYYSAHEGACAIYMARIRLHFSGDR